VYKVNIQWIGEQQYVAEAHERRHAMVLDVSPKAGGADTGFHATELLLVAVGKCSAVDIVNILRKKRLDLTKLQIEVSGEIALEPAKHFSNIHVKYIASGEGVTEKKVAEAVHLSHGKYCTVSNSLSDKCKLTTEIVIE